MRLFYDSTTGEILLISIAKKEPGYSVSPHPYIDVEVQDVNNKCVDTNTRTLIDKE